MSVVIERAKIRLRALWRAIRDTGCANCNGFGFFEDGGKCVDCLGAGLRCDHRRSA